MFKKIVALLFFLLALLLFFLELRQFHSERDTRREIAKYENRKDIVALAQIAENQKNERYCRIEALIAIKELIRSGKQHLSKEEKTSIIAILLKILQREGEYGPIYIHCSDILFLLTETPVPSDVDNIIPSELGKYWEKKIPNK